jgi:allantoicase/malate synthase/2-oxo-4-hydroxy-4-carboxy--5-ureidoimidazoline (OHCU) decarboxylase
MKKREIPYYQDYISESVFQYLKPEMKPVEEVPGLMEVGKRGGLENQESLAFLCELYDLVKADLNRVLEQRRIDREFIDQRTRACYELNQKLGIDFLDPEYQTILGQEDGHGRIVMGPHNEYYCKSGKGSPIAPIPKFLQGHHVTLFGPPDDPKLSINAMNAFHRKLKDEPAVVTELLSAHPSSPKWGADDEDSKTPLREDLISAGENLTGCFNQNLQFTDPKNQKTYALEKENLSLPIKRFPGLALPSSFLFYRDNPLPLHLYDFAMHLFANWQTPEALAFYVPKLENEEEARYIRLVMETAEKLIQKRHSQYQLGSIRLMIVLENPRAVFRVNEIMDELHPYFAGASLGWHDYLGSTARLFKEDGNYRIPVKADPNIVIRYIKASHDLLSEVVGSRGGIKVGGMYGVLPSDNEIKSPSFQVTVKGFIKDVITQMKRNLSGYWVAHPDFVRLGVALVEAWKIKKEKGDSSKLESLVTSLLEPKYHAEILQFLHGPDIEGLRIEDPLYKRSLIVADIKESTYIANNHPEEVRYNIFQSLQYLTDWLSGNGCVALPAQIEGVPVRVMDDLATAERSRWEVWHELYHGRFSMEEFLKIVHEEMHFIRKDLSNDKKIVQVKWDERTAKWYPIAMNLMILLMTSRKPVEFATELLMPFTIESIRNQPDPWKAITNIDTAKFAFDEKIERFHSYFSMCGSLKFAQAMSRNLVLDLDQAEKLITSFEMPDILQAAWFHGNIGESQKTLEAMASREQALVFQEEERVLTELKELGQKYLEKFGVKFLISAQGKSGKEMLAALKERLNNGRDLEIENARKALWEITRKRCLANPANSLHEKIPLLLQKHKVTGASLCISSGPNDLQSLCFGESRKGHSPVTPETRFEIASLSKSIASAFAIEYFRKAGIPLSSSVNALLANTFSAFRIPSLNADHPEWGDQVTIAQLMNHNGLNLHYVNGVPWDQPMPNVSEFLKGNTKYGYAPVGVINEPGSIFQYSGGGFLVLEHLIESLEQKGIPELTAPFLKELGLRNTSFEQKNLLGVEYASGYFENGNEIPSSRKMFPAFAAGAMGNAEDLEIFLSHLTKAFHNLEGSGPISHETAVLMLYGSDKGCRKFMGARMGLGVFIAEAGPNRLALHQGANDGFRCLYVHCFAGPDRGKGFSILCNAELNGVLFISEVAQGLLQALKIHGVDTSLFQSQFKSSQLKPEEVVNIGYKNLIFDAFQEDLPEEIIEKGPLSELAAFNLAVGGKVLEVSNQRFARAENLLSPHDPIFDPSLFGKQGKIMDSWESVRHNQKAFDELIFELKKPSSLKYASFSTQYHFGNQAQAVSLDGLISQTGQWQKILDRTELQGHSWKGIELAGDSTVYSQIRVRMYPDGGLSRLGLFNESLPEKEKLKFAKADQAISHRFPDFSAQTQKPLSPKYVPTLDRIQQNWQRLGKMARVDLASSAWGAKILRASNEHYGPAAQVISPYPPLNMFDGLESARSREKGHSEEVVIELARAGTIDEIEIDFTYFVNNNPYEIQIEGLPESSTEWQILIAKTFAKPFAGNQIRFALAGDVRWSQLKVTTFPDGGMNRIHVWTAKDRLS